MNAAFNRGTLMMVVGVVMVLGGTAWSWTTPEPMAVPLLVVGLVSIAVGARQRRVNGSG